MLAPSEADKLTASRAFCMPPPLADVRCSSAQGVVVKPFAGQPNRQGLQARDANQLGRAGAPPVYRPQVPPAQRKPDSRPADSVPPAAPVGAPPIYRPTMAALAQRGTALPDYQQPRSGAPPVYRPQPLMSQLRPATAPVYRPTAKPLAPTVDRGPSTAPPVYIGNSVRGNRLIERPLNGPSGHAVQGKVETRSGAAQRPPGSVFVSCPVPWPVVQCAMGERVAAKNQARRAFSPRLRERLRDAADSPAPSSDRDWRSPERQRREPGIWDGRSRSPWNEETWDALWQRGGNSTDASNTRLYKCEDCSKDFYRKRDNPGIVIDATIDHKKDYRTWILERADPEIDGKITIQSAKKAYNDLRNLQILCRECNSRKNGPKGIYD